MKALLNIVLIATVLVSVVLTGCGGGGGASTSPGGQSGTNPTATLSSITVTPTSPTVTAGATQQFTATGNYSSGVPQDLTSNATWTSSDNSIATVSATGLATSIRAGTVTITAKSGTVTGTTTLTVTAGTIRLAAISITPNAPSIASGKTQQFTAFGTYTDGSSKDITAEVQWSSSATNIATVSASGLATGVSQGQANISATSGSISKSAALTVTTAVLQYIDITPDAPSIPAGGKVQFTATGTFSDGTTQDLTKVTWSSSNTSVATIASDGTANAIASSGTPVTITATVGAISDTTGLTVTDAALVSVAITPDDASIAKGTTEQYTATGTFTDGSQQDAAVTWNSSNTGIATIDMMGLATGVGQGSTTITAHPTAVPDATTSLTVTPAVVSQILVTPALPKTGIGGTVQFSATARFSDGSTQDVTPQVTWMSSSAAVATITSAGVANAISSGTATISATYEGVNGSTTLTVSTATLQSIVINNLPSSPDDVGSLNIGKSARMQLYAWGVFSDSTTRRLATVSWSSSSGRIASVGNSGMVRSKKHTGTATISARSGNITGTLSVSVSTATITSITVRPADSSLPATPTIAAGTGIQLVALATYSDNTTQNVGSYAYWKTSDYSKATVTTSGFARALKPGAVNVSMSYGGVTASTTINVSSASLQSLEVSPSTATVPLGFAQAYTVNGTFSDASKQDLTTQATWSSSNVAVAVVDRFGVAVSTGRGTADITAKFQQLTSPAKTMSATLNVN